MNVKFGLKPESYKLITANRWVFDPATIDTFGTSLTVTAGRGDRTAFQAILRCDTEYILNMGMRRGFPRRVLCPCSVCTRTTIVS